MKLPRYITGRSNVSELSAPQTLSPAMAAQTAMAKSSMFAAGATSISKSAEIISDIQAEDETNNGVRDIELELTQFDYELAHRPLEVKDNKIVMDVDQMLKDELKGRNEIISKIRGRVESGKAQRNIDNYITRTAQRRNEYYAGVANARRVKVMGAQAVQQTEEYRKNKAYDLADQVVTEALSLGNMSQKQAFDEIQATKVARTMDYASEAWLSESYSDMNDAIKFVTEGVLPDGKETGLDLTQTTAVVSKLETRMNGFEIEAQKAAKVKQLQNYVSMMEMKANDTLTDEMVIEAGKQNMVSESQFDKLLGDDDPVKDDRAALESIDAMVVAFTIGDTQDWDGDLEKLSMAISEVEGVSWRTKGTRIDALRGRVSEIVPHPIYRSVQRQAHVAIVGFEESALSDMAGKLSSNYNIMAEDAVRLQRMASAKAFDLGPNRLDELSPWLEEQLPVWKLRTNAKILSKVGVNVDIPEDGILTDAIRDDISSQMTIWFESEVARGRGKKANKRLLDTIKDIEDLTGITLTTIDMVGG